MFSQVGSNQIAPWMEAFGHRNLQGLEQANARPFQAFQGERIPGLNPALQASFQMAQNPYNFQPDYQMGRNYTQFGSMPFPDVVQHYMNPYQKNVSEEINRQGGEFLNKYILPQIAARYDTSGASLGSKREQLEREARKDMEQEVFRRQGLALHHGYEHAGQIHGQDRARELAAGQNAIGLGGEAQRQHIANIALQQGVGERQYAHQGAENERRYQDYLREQQHPQQGFLQNLSALHGLPTSSQTATATQGPQQYRPDTLSQIGGGAAQVLGALNRNRPGAKAGGSIKKKKKGLGDMNFAESSMARHPKVGGKYPMKRGK